MNWFRFKKVCHRVGDHTPYRREDICPTPLTSSVRPFPLHRVVLTSVCTVAAAAAFIAGSLHAWPTSSLVPPASVGSTFFTKPDRTIVPSDDMPLTPAGVGDSYGYAAGQLYSGVPSLEAAVSQGEWYTLQTTGVSLLAPVDRYLYREVGTDMEYSLPLAPLQTAMQALYGRQAPSLPEGTPDGEGRTSLCQLVTPHAVYQLYRYKAYPQLLFAARAENRWPENLFYFVEKETFDGNRLTTRVVTIRICDEVVDYRLFGEYKTQLTTAGYALPWDTDSYETAQEKLRLFVEAVRMGGLKHLSSYVTLSAPVTCTFMKQESGAVALIDRDIDGTGDENNRPSCCASKF